jgi:hypothetical protein
VLFGAQLMLTSAFVLFNPCSQICDTYIAPPGCGDLAFPSVQVQLLKPNMKPAARNFEIQRIVRRANVRRIRGSYEQLIKVQSAMKAGDNKTVEVSRAARLFAMHRFVDTLLLLLLPLPLSVSLSPILFFNYDEHLPVREHRIVCVRRAYMAIVWVPRCVSHDVRAQTVTDGAAERGKRARSPGKELRESSGKVPAARRGPRLAGTFVVLFADCHGRGGRGRKASACVRVP